MSFKTAKATIGKRIVDLWNPPFTPFDVPSSTSDEQLWVAGFGEASAELMPLRRRQSHHENRTNYPSPFSRAFPLPRSLTKHHTAKESNCRPLSFHSSARSPLNAWGSFADQYSVTSLFTRVARDSRLRGWPLYAPSWVSLIETRDLCLNDTL
jgi:hypothetical protein